MIRTVADSDFTTFDHSGMRLGDTNEAQLKGRARLIVQHTAAALGLALLISTLSIGQQPFGLMNCMILGSLALLAIRSVKEVAAHAYARYQEKQAFGIEEETEETRYTLTEFISEENQHFNESRDRFRETMRILLTRPEETSPNLVNQTELDDFSSKRVLEEA